MEPTKLFDNLYALGNSEATVYAVTTSGGIVLIDSGYTDQVETVVVPGLRALGLDPAQVKYVLVGHGHGDHFGGARYFQERGARVGLSAADWELVQPATTPATAPAQPRPTRDLVLAEGQPVTLGEQTITPVLIPGHTPGSLAFTFQVRDGRQVHVAGLFGGTILTSGRITTPGLRQYVASIDHYLSVARRERVDVEVQNHPLFDDMAGRLAATRARKAGAPHPFVVGRDRYVRFWSIVSECMQAELARRVS
jgi:metallo-beta-lactamase class B